MYLLLDKFRGSKQVMLPNQAHLVTFAKVTACRCEPIGFCVIDRRPVGLAMITLEMIISWQSGSV
jgi:hypothetical protein